MNYGSASDHSQTLPSPSFDPTEMPQALINLDPHHIAQLVYQVWTQGESAGEQLAELQVIHQFFQSTSDDGGLALGGACDDADLPRGSTSAKVVAAFLASIGKETPEALE